ncbi:dihydrolipoyl dehydrogenase [Halalkalibacterium halodurans]|jgi:dihydrolipoamide dehydrogenase|uniref:dihydrolipoyl dehydrogenase n=1 Tax=Halalkalibacterium halodurans TaxID=86665 RepID=UPI002E1F6F29|nr:dihydrolipoyl dehydrogenase [Halalkalibacterium halodurans]MED4080249.1 dihydrolipoyl dehydrogenase [Halalkalibacterium halodurans]MED4084683.1 dihydrolipoyl dehydrogenase [Halalkalibacterium halodurans]MED4103937.1 dihydrolipoyl dehydrogenase [Halalkalibacterium halodurans]MED4108991.1 dihydrolipoyl dehydrogenase [Halalkalibacterium halodurans]
MAEEYDLVILGGGTGGYVAAIRATQLDLKVALVEKGKLGGTCLHKGCIPSKALLRSAEVFSTVQKADQFGVKIDGAALDFTSVQNRKEQIVTQLHRGVEMLMKKGKIDVYKGHGRILGPSIFSPTPGTISVEMNNGEDNMMLIPRNVIIATGSSPRVLPGMEVDGEAVLTSDEALKMEQLPKSMLIVGGGVIGIEWASMLNDFGVDVTVIEYGPRILPTEDADIAKEAERLLKKRGVTFKTNAKVLAETLEKGDNSVVIEAEVGGVSERFTAEKMLVSVGRTPNVNDIGLENTDIEVIDGAIAVNEWYQTKESHIYAIGDVIGGMQLAHVASHEGILAVEHMTDHKPEPLNYLTVARCVYSHPEMASIGLSEAEAKEKGYEVKVGTFPFQAIGKALVYGESDGFVKILSDKKTDDLLGVHMIGPHVTDMISEAALAKVLDAAHWEVAQTIHPHPTLSEVVGEAALAVDGKAIHF